MSSIKVEGLKVHYNAPLGLPTQPSEHLVMLVHSAGGSSRLWEPLIPLLGEGVFPVAVDLPGHGATDGYVPDSIKAVADFLAAFLSELGAERPVCYVGHSIGGLIGLQFALAYSALVERLVLVSTAARVQLHPDFLAQAISGQWDLELLRQSFAPEVPEHVKELVLGEFQHTRCSADASDFMGVELVDLTEAISQLRVPTLILTGDDDVIISPRKSNILQRQIPGARLVKVPSAGHYLNVEKSSLLAEEIKHFLAE